MILLVNIQIRPVLAKMRLAGDSALLAAPEGPVSPKAAETWTPAAKEPGVQSKLLGPTILIDSDEK